jgi:drug/metabolite transporter (DMT)-like permease
VSVGTRKFNPVAGMRRSELPRLAALSVCIGAQSMLYLMAVYYLPVSIAVCLFFLFPVLTYVLESLLGKHPWSGAMLAGYAMAVLGVWALVSGGKVEAASLIGIAAGIGAGLAQAFVNLFSVRAASVGRLELLRIGFVIPLALAAVLWLAGGQEHDVPAVAWSAVAGLTYLGGIFLFLTSLRTVGSVKASTYMYVEPVMTIGFGMLLHSETLGLVQAGGIGLIAAAIALIEAKTQKPPIPAMHA